jgi:hypothetical protein
LEDDRLEKVRPSGTETEKRFNGAAIVEEANPVDLNSNTYQHK